MNRSLTLCLVVTLTAALPVAGDVIIPGSASVGESPLVPGTGLRGHFYDLPDDSDHWVRTNSTAQETIQAYAPSATFISTLLDYDDRHVRFRLSDVLVFLDKQQAKVPR